MVTLVAFFALDTLNALLALVTLVAFFALGTCRSHFSGSFHIERFPILTIVIGNIPEVIITDFELRCSTIDTVCSVCAVLAVCTIRCGSLDAGIGSANPPVAVFADAGGQTVCTVRAVCTVRSGSFYACVGFTDPPVSVFANAGGQTVRTVRAVCTVRSGSFYAGISSADPPVTVFADAGGQTIRTVRAVCTVRSGSFYACVGSANPPVTVFADAGGQTIRTVRAVCTIRSDSFYACVGFTDPPVAVFANVGRFTVLAFFTILTVGACRLNFRIRKADPPVAVLTDIRSFAVLARLSVVTGRFYAGVGSPDPPVAIATDVRRFVRAIMRLVGPNALIILAVYRCYGRHYIGVLAIQVKVFDLIFRCFGRQLFGYFCIRTAFVLAVNIVASNLRMTVFAVRLCPRKLQVKDAFAAGYCLVQIVDGSRRRGKIGNTVADKGCLVVRCTTQVALPLPQRPMESIGVYNRRGNSFRHKALLVQTGDGAARSHRSAFGGGISLAIAIFKACGDTVHSYILIAPFYGAVEEKPVGHFYAFCGGVFLRPCHLIQRSVIAQSKLRFADGGSLNIRIQSAPAIMVIAVGVALVAVHPVGSGIDLLQQVAGRVVFAVGHVLVILCGKLVVGIHRKLLIHRSLRNGSLHDSFIVPCAVRVLYVIFVDEHRCTADNNTVVGLCGKALTPLLVQRTLEGLRPVQCITCFNGCLSAEEVEFGAVAYTEGHAVRVPVRQLIAFRQDILCFVIARIHYLIKIGRRLQDRLDIRVRVGVSYTPVFGKDTIVVLVHGDNQKADRILGIGVHIAVRRNKAVISAGCSVLLYFAVYRCIIIVYAPHIARQQVGLVVIFVLEGNCKHHLFPPGLVAVEVAHGNGLDVTVGDAGGAARAVIGAAEVSSGIHRHRLIVADIIESTVYKNQFLCPPAPAVDGHRLYGKPLPDIVRIMVAAVGPAVGSDGAVCRLGKGAADVGHLSHIHIWGIHGDGLVDHAGIFFPGAEFSQHTGQEQVYVTVAVQISAGKAGSYGELVASAASTHAHVGAEDFLLRRGLGDNGTAVLGAIDDLELRQIVVDFGLIIGQPVAVGQHRQIVYAVPVKVAYGHGNAQLAPLIASRVLYIIPRVLVVVAHQQAVALAPPGKTSAVIVPLLDLAASGIGGLRGIDHDAFLAVAVKVTGHDVQEAAVGVGGHLKAISVIHVCKITDVHRLAAVGARPLPGIDDPQIAPLVGNPHKGHMVFPSAAGGVKGHCLHQGVGVNGKRAVGTAFLSCEGRQRGFRTHVKIGGLADLISPDIQIHQLVLLHHEERHPHIVAIGVGGRRIAAGLYVFQIH